MAYYCAETNPEHGSFEAIIGTDEDYSSGHIRIAPPFTPGESLLGLLVADGIHLGLVAVGESATILDYLVPNKRHDETYLSKVQAGVDEILKVLGTSTKPKNFTKHWGKFEEKD